MEGKAIQGMRYIIHIAENRAMTRVEMLEHDTKKLRCSLSRRY